jgi:hypothetical protein
MENVLAWELKQSFWKEIHAQLQWECRPKPRIFCYFINKMYHTPFSRSTIWVDLSTLVVVFLKVLQWVGKMTDLILKNLAQTTAVYFHVQYFLSIKSLGVFFLSVQKYSVVINRTAYSWIFNKYRQYLWKDM